MNKGDYYVEKNEMNSAMEEYNKAMKMFPLNLEMEYWTAITLANNNQIAKASTMLARIYRKDKSWRELTKRLPKAGLLTVSENDMKQLVK
jgi:predicted Zn-dependent protease